MRRRVLLAAVGTATVGLGASCTGLPADDPTATRSTASSTADSPTGETGTDTGQGSPSDDPSPTRSERSSPTRSERSSPTPTDCEMELAETAFDVLSVECGTGENSADASVDPSGDATPDDGDGRSRYTVTVTGTIDGSDTCHSARLVAAETVRDGHALRVAVESHVPESNEGRACGDCIVDVDYRATAEYRCDYPDVAEVVHDDEQIAEIPLPE